MYELTIAFANTLAWLQDQVHGALLGGDLERVLELEELSEHLLALGRVLRWLSVHERAQTDQPGDDVVNNSVLPARRHGATDTARDRGSAKLRALGVEADRARARLDAGSGTQADAEAVLRVFVQLQSVIPDPRLQNASIGGPQSQENMMTEDVEMTGREASRAGDGAAERTVGAGGDPYVEWEATLRSGDQRRGWLATGHTHLTACVRVRDDAALQALQAIPSCHIDQHELDYRALTGAQDLIVCLASSEVLPDGVVLIGRGLPVRLPDGGPAATEPAFGRTSGVRAEPAPVAAPLSGASDPVDGSVSRHAGGTMLSIIDDGLGFLNARFRSGPGGGQTRFEAVWLQVQTSPAGGASWPGLSLGRILERHWIDAALTQGAENRIYRDINRALFTPDTVRTVEQAASHGTHMADLAGGAAATGGDVSDAEMRDVTLLGVQLPPAAVDDTSGVRMILPVLQGVRWSIWRALQAGCQRLVINLSVGVTAGSKDGTGLLTRQIAQEVTRAQALGLEIDVTLPFGNDYLHRQVAEVTLSGTTGCELGLRLLPDDRTPSYVEIRPARTGTDLGTVPIALAPPGGTAQPQTLAAGEVRDIRDGTGAIVARLSHVPATPDGDAWLALCFAPTAPLLLDGGPTLPAGPVARAGVWEVRLGPCGEMPRLRLEIQRDDRALGYRQAGRQAVWEDPGAYGFHPQPGINAVNPKSYVHAQPGALVSYDGSHNAFATIDSDRAHVVAAAWLHARDPHPDGAVAAHYSAAGWRRADPDLGQNPGAQPDVAVVSGHLRANPGVRASGVLSGSSARLTGTSAASALYARRLVLGGTGALTVPRAQGSEHRLPETVTLFSRALAG